MELEVFKNMERVFNATTQQEQVIAENSNGYSRGFNSCEEFYLKVDVDAVLAEKDAEIAELQETNVIIANNAVRLNKEIAELKAKIENVQASAYAESVDAGMRERRLRRALYKACANWADVVAFEETEGIGYDNSVAERWRKMESKCLKKAKEYR